ncbi:TSUP family transporter (plasmid) [Rubrobacter tropicus]|uniref:Probable membrane transporter protein n=1 Tax=Rubrobacter tropicus TaxID=2653851 RepID=A0A6G8QFX3_9ACTN|nr:sulfite exporter TauE/SafE family protein [Rubrobacter tropicus]QIN85416.1 TSUP family transporter [Rubrobacter tropicus]
MTEVGLLDLVLGALMGLALGTLGGGGSVLTVPILVYVAGFGAREAVAYSLAVVGVTSLFGSVGHWRAGNVNWRVALVFGPFAVTGTYAGARLSVFFGETAQLALFAAVMLVAALFMLRGGRAAEEAGLEGDGGGPRLGARPTAWIAAEGVAVGVVTGLVGVGGGFLIIPALVLLAGVPMKQAVGTSLLIITAKSAAGFAGYAGQVEVPWAYLSSFTAAALAGIVAGTRVVRFVPQDRLKRYFAVFLIAMGLFVLGENVLTALK